MGPRLGCCKRFDSTSRSCVSAFITLGIARRGPKLCKAAERQSEHRLRARIWGTGSAVSRLSRIQTCAGIQHPSPHLTSPHLTLHNNSARFASMSVLLAICLFHHLSSSSIRLLRAAACKTRPSTILRIRAPAYVPRSVTVTHPHHQSRPGFGPSCILLLLPPPQRRVTSCGQFLYIFISPC